MEGINRLGRWIKDAELGFLVPMFVMAAILAAYTFAPFVIMDSLDKSTPHDCKMVAMCALSDTPVTEWLLFAVLIAVITFFALAFILPAIGMAIAGTVGWVILFSRLLGGV